MVELVGQEIVSVSQSGTDKDLRLLVIRTWDYEIVVSGRGMQLEVVKRPLQAGERLVDGEILYSADWL